MAFPSSKTRSAKSSSVVRGNYRRSLFGVELIIFVTSKKARYGNKKFREFRLLNKQFRDEKFPFANLTKNFNF